MYRNALLSYSRLHIHAIKKISRYIYYYYMYSIVEEARVEVVLRSWRKANLLYGGN